MTTQNQTRFLGESELVTYWRLFLRWWWLLVLAGAITGTAGYLLSKRHIPVYQSTAQVLVEGVSSSSAGGATEFFASQQLAQLYSQIVATRPVLDEVAKRLSLTGPPSLTVTSRQAFISIVAKANEPSLAAAIANTSADVMIQVLRDRQLTQIAQFQNSLAQYGVGPDPAILATQAARVSNLSVIEPAVPALKPIDETTVRYLIFAALLGLAGSAALILVLESVRDSITTDEELATVTGFEAVGVVPRYPVENNYTAVALSGHGNRAAIGAYEFLRANLEFVAMGRDRKLTRLLLTSPGVGDGKTTTAVNLAAVYAREGKRVILVDLDLRHPGVRRFFHPVPAKGVTNIVMGDAEIDDVLFTPPGVEGLRVLTTGPLPANPISVMRTQRFVDMLNRLQEKADIVVLDSPPILAVPDPLLIAKMADAVLLVVDSGKSRRSSVRRAARLLDQADPQMAVTVLNKVAVNRGPQYYQYYYYTQYYSKAGRNGRNGSNGAKKLGRFRLPSLPGLRRGNGQASREEATENDSSTTKTRS